MIEEKVLKNIKISDEIINKNSLEKNVFIYDGKYMIQSLIYCGENGFVYTALNIFNNRKVIIKEFFPRNSIKIDNESLEFVRAVNGSVELFDYSEKKFDIFLILIDKFLKEAEYLKKLSKSKYIVTINESFKLNNTSYIVLDYIEYPTLKSVMISNKKISPESLIDLYYSLLEATDFIHKNNIVHRDLKPSNLFVTPDGIIIGDFGISKYLDEFKSSNTIVYSESFSAPEQISGMGNQGTWTDIYSLGKIFEYLIMKVGYTEEFNTENKSFENGLDLMSVIVNKNTLIEFINDACNVDINKRLKNISSIKSKLIEKKKDTLKVNNKLRNILVSIIVCAFLMTFVFWNRQTYLKDNIEINNPSMMYSELVESESNKSEILIEDEIEFEEMKFITSDNIEMEFNSLKDIVWTNPDNHEGYYISITDLNTWTAMTPYKFYTKDSKLDLNLSPFNKKTPCSIAGR